MLLVLDDFSAISSGDEAVNLVERAREFNVGVVLTTQSYAGFGVGGDRIIDAANGALIVHRLGTPEPFITRAGTVWRHVKSITEPARQPGVISSVIFKTKPEMLRHTTREQEFGRIDANEVRSLPPGEAFVIADGKAQRVRVLPVSDIDAKVDMPGIGTVSLIDLGRGNLNVRKELNADLHATEAKLRPRLSEDPDLDF